MREDPNNDPQAERRKQADRRAESTRRMLRAAIALIAENGAKGATLADIGRHAGYSSGLAAERFGTKLNLLCAVMDACQEWFEKRSEAALEGRRGLAALRARIRFHMTAVCESTEAATTLYQLMVEAAAALPELQPRVSALHEAYRRRLRQDLAQAEADGELPAGVDKERVAGLLLSIMLGYALQAFADGCFDELPRAAGEAAEMVIRDLSAKSVN
ncbi:MAG: TetR/AcrR family transcriptional regulator [Pikeienuella sp.]